jgi:hypothetical protein
MSAEARTTLYLRGMPRSVVREAKAAAAREGVTLAQWVTARLGPGAAPLAPETQAREPSGDLAGDLAFYEAHRAELGEKYPGEYLAIIDRVVVDHDASFEALAARVFRKHGTRPVCMPLVGRAEVRVRSPRRATG